MGIARRILGKIYRHFFPKINYVIGDGSKLFPQAKVHNSLAKSAITIGNQTRILAELHVFPHGGQIKIGDECFIGEGTRVWAGKSISIGNRVLISHNVNIFDSQTHSFSAKERNKHFKQIFSTGHPKEIDLGERPIVIEDDAWIACMSIILRGVHIGQGAVVAAGSVVTKDVPAWTIVAGNPAKVIRTLSEDER